MRDRPCAPSRVGVVLCLVALLHPPATLAAAQDGPGPAPAVVEERGPGEEAPTEPEEAEPEEKMPPPFRVGLAAGRSERSGDFEELSLRAGFDRLDGGLPVSFELLPTRLRRDPDRGSVRVEQALLWDMVFGDGSDWVVLMPSRLGAVRLRDTGCAECLAWVVDIGMGAGRGASGGWPPGFFFILYPLDLAASRDFRGSDVRAGMGASGGLEASWFRRRLSAEATASWRHLFSAPHRTYELGLGARWFVGWGLALDARGTYYPDHRYPMTYEGTLGLLYYFGRWD